MFMLSILLMVLPTFILAFIPGYETLGFLAPVFIDTYKNFSRHSYRWRITWSLGFVREHRQEKQKAFFLSCLNQLWL